jgi:hypothetical protein
VRKDHLAESRCCLDHQRPTSLEGTNCVSSLTYSSTISLHLSVCRLPGTLSPIYLPIPGAVLSSPSPPHFPPSHPLIPSLPAGPQLSPNHIYERHCLLLVRRLFDLHRLSHFFSLLRTSPTNFAWPRWSISIRWPQISLSTLCLSTTIILVQTRSRRHLIPGPSLPRAGFCARI